jgi:AcrR family transcriptional regulator
MGRRSREDQALLALISEPTIAKAAEASGISQATLFRYLQDKEFRAEYQRQKRTLLDAALSDLHAAAGDAVACLVEIMTDTKVTPAARVAAARAVLGYSIDTAKIEDVIRRLEAIEEKLKL